MWKMAEPTFRAHIENGDDIRYGIPIPIVGVIERKIG